MEQSLKAGIDLQATRNIPSDKRLPLSLITLILLIGFIIVILVVRTLTQYIIPAHPNPFVTYAGIFPGKPVTAAEAIGFSCYIIGYQIDGDPFDKHCYLHPATGVFSSLDILVSKNIIHQITFVPLNHTMTIGDLELFLDSTAIHVYYHSVLFLLPRRFIVAKTSGYPGQFSPFIPVTSVSFADIISPR